MVQSFVSVWINRLIKRMASRNNFCIMLAWINQIIDTQQFQSFNNDLRTCCVVECWFFWCLFSYTFIILCLQNKACFWEIKALKVIILKVKPINVLKKNTREYKWDLGICCWWWFELKHFGVDRAVMDFPKFWNHFVPEWKQSRKLPRM